MARTFTYAVRSTPAELYRKIEELRIQHPDMPLDGDERSGTLTKWKGFAGSYAMTKMSKGTEVVVTITDKPALVPWSVIESQLNKVTKDL